MNIGNDRVWDLSENRPGESARRQATALQQAAPVRSFVGRVLGVKNSERAWRVGADGEEAVGRRLEKLSDAWRVIHAVPVGDRGSDIDHVVIGPAGVFTLNTKNHSGSKVWVAQRSLLVNGHKTDYLRNSRHEATRASKFLTAVCGFAVIVEPVIVVLAAELTIKELPSDVHVVARRKINGWLAKRPVMLDAATVSAIFAMARRDTTWRNPTPGDVNRRTEL